MDIMKDAMKIAPAVAAVGALNWGLVTFANFNVVDKIVAMVPATIPAAKIIYGAVGVAGALVLLNLKK